MTERRKGESMIQTTGEAPSAEFLLKMLVDLLADQKELKIEYKIVKGENCKVKAQNEKFVEVGD